MWSILVHVDKAKQTHHGRGRPLQTYSNGCCRWLHCEARVVTLAFLPVGGEKTVSLLVAPHQQMVNGYYIVALLSSVKILLLVNKATGLSAVCYNWLVITGNMK